jgi:hypothetical protein
MTTIMNGILQDVIPCRLVPTCQRNPHPQPSRVNSLALAHSIGQASELNRL